MRRIALILCLLASVGLATAGPVSTYEKQEPPPTRSELMSSETVLPAIEGPSRDAAMRTPLPVEMAEHATTLPEGWALVVPFEGTFRITNGYGYQTEGWTHRTIGNETTANDFYALDFGMPEGTPVYAARGGQIVTSSMRSDSYGNYIVIDHGEGITSIYAHLASREFEVMHGQPEVHVEAGQLIGHSGKTGTYAPHLHFAVHTDSVRSRSGADVGGLATVPEPLGGWYFLREGNELTGGEAAAGE